MTKPTLILTIGLPRSGKSTWARQQIDRAAIVCPDEIRSALHGQHYIKSAEPMVWATARLMVAALFGSGHQTVILDACNHTDAYQKVWEDDRWTVELQPFMVPVQECRYRAKESGQDYLIPVIDRMYKEIHFKEIYFPVDSWDLDR